ncbi:MAG: hypothetical protein U9M89_02805 [Patescibacteria group bacterium]|nr:hypothetical protein [Patescibacteria group bacterium]
MKFNRPSEDKWSQSWDSSEADLIENIAVEMRKEVSMDDASLWMSAEGEFSSNSFVKDYKEGSR